MVECSECGKQTMSFTCHYCGKKFCSEDRLPENHDCEGLETGKRDEYMPESSPGKAAEEKAGKEPSESTAGSQQKWFPDRGVKDEVKRGTKVRKPTLSRDIIDVFRNNFTYSIIAVTVFFFVIQNFMPGISPPFTQAQFQTVIQNPQLLNPLTLYPSIAYILQRPWTLATVMLMHGGFFHLFANMVTLYFFGSALEKSIGKSKLLKFYIGTGIASSIGFVVFSNILNAVQGAAFSPAVGASGAVVAAVGAVAVLYPDAEVLLYFIIPMKIKTAVYAFGAMETLNIIAKLGGIYLPVIGGFASSAHLTGLVIGIIIGRKYRDQVRNRRGISIFQ